MLAVVGIALLALGWIVVTGLLARSALQSARAQLPKAERALSVGHIGAARAIAQRMVQDAESAHARTSGPAWWAAAQLPWLGDPLQSARVTSADVDLLAHTAVPAALQAADDLAPQQLLTGHDTINLDRLTAATAPIDRAIAATRRVADRLRSASGAHTWLGLVDHPRAQVVAAIGKLTRRLGTLATITKLAPPLLGGDGPRRYFVAFENEAEARGLGGLPGEYAIVQFDHGRFGFTQFGSDDALLGARSTANLGRDFQQTYVDEFSANTEFRNSDVSPHFPYAAQTWLSMWEQRFHQRLDGAIATDPSALSYLLRAIGSVRLVDGQLLVPANVAQVLESAVYTKFPGLSHAAIEAHKAYLVDAAQRIIQAVTSKFTAKPAVLLQALSQAAKEKRLVFFSSRADEETQLVHWGIAGQLAQTTRPFAGLVVNNGSGSKLDYYLDRRVTYQRSTCAATTSTITVRLRNSAPTSGLPAYVTRAVGVPKNEPGTNEELVSMFLTQGADLTGVSLDGHDAFYDQSVDRGHPVATVDVLLHPGQTRTLTYHVKEPRATGPVQIPVQPLVRDQGVIVKSPACTGRAA